MFPLQCRRQLHTSNSENSPQSVAAENRDIEQENGCFAAGKCINRTLPALSKDEVVATTPFSPRQTMHVDPARASFGNLVLTVFFHQLHIREDR
jgi:hypothetical protein